MWVPGETMWSKLDGNKIIINKDGNTHSVKLEGAFQLEVWNENNPEYSTVHRAMLKFIQENSLEYINEKRNSQEYRLSDQQFEEFSDILIDLLDWEEED